MARKKTIKETDSVTNDMVEEKVTIVYEEHKEEPKTEEIKESDVLDDIVEEVLTETESTIEEIKEETPIKEEKITEAKIEKPKEKLETKRINRYSFGYTWNGQEFEF